LAFLTQNKAKLCKILIITLLFEKNAIFCRKLAKIAENCDHNIDPRDLLGFIYFLITLPLSHCGSPKKLTNVCISWFRAGFDRFFLAQYTKTRENVPNYTTLPNGHKIYQHFPF
jgi:hypothetical protein